MSITVLTQPSGLESALKPLIFEVTTTSTDYRTRILCEVFYKPNPGAFWTKIDRKIQDKYPGKDYFKFNVANVLAEVLSFDYVDTQTTGIYTPNENSVVSYYCKFTEYTPDGDGQYQPGATNISGELYACNTALDFIETQDLSTFVYSATPTKFLTDSPDIQSIRVGEKVELHFLTNETIVKGKHKITKTNGTTTTTTTNLSTQDIKSYLWPFEIDSSNVVTIPNESDFIDNISAGSTYSVISDSNADIYGGIKLVNNTDLVDIKLATGQENIRLRLVASSGSQDFEVWFYDGSTWNFDSVGTATTTAANADIHIPSGSTMVRVILIDSSPIYIIYGYTTKAYSTLIFKRGIFNLRNNVIAADTAKIELWIEDNSSNRISDIKTYNADQRALTYSTRFAFKNKKGGFDHYTFTGGHSSQLDVEKSNYYKELPTSFTKKDRGRGVFYVTSDKVFNCFSDFEDQTTLQWLITLIESTEVFLIVDDTRIAVEILTTSAPDLSQSDLLQLSVSWRYAVKRNIAHG